LDRQKNEIEKLNKQLEEEQQKGGELTETVNRLELEISKTKMEFQFKEEKFNKEHGYAKDRQTNLESVKIDLETQLAAANTSIANFKTN
jgi:cell division protein FtsB